MASTVILLAAGNGQRMRGSVADKALAMLAGKTALGHCVQAFLTAGISGPMVVVYRDISQLSALKHTVASVHPDSKQISWVQGGSERQQSVWQALQATPDDSEHVYIHDVARPCIHPASLAALQTAVERDGAAVLAHPVTDTVKRVPDPNQLRSIQLEDLDRSRLWAMETPQAFDARKIRTAYQHVHEYGLKVTDDAAAAATIGLKITLVPNPYPNPKLTTPCDVEYIEHILKAINLPAAKRCSEPP